MAKNHINTRIITRHDTASNWNTNNPTLLSGEIALETDTKVMKVGDGSTAYQSLPNFLLDNAKVTDIVSQSNAKSADKLKESKQIELSGDIAGAAPFDGSANANIVTVVSKVSGQGIITEHSTVNDVIQWLSYVSDTGSMSNPNTDPDADVSGLIRAVNDATKDIPDIKNDIELLGGRLTLIEPIVTANETAIGVLQSSVDTMNSRVSAVIVTATNANEAVQEMKSTVQSNTNRITKLEENSITTTDSIVFNCGGAE